MSPARRTVLAGGLAVAAGLAAPMPATARDSSARALTWDRLPDLPANDNDWSPRIPVGETYWSQIGLAGPIAGAVGDHLLVGGGANFPEPALTASRGGTLGKVYWDELFVLRRGGTGYEWLPGSHRLRDAVAYAACLSTDHGLLVVGGEGFRGGPSGSGLGPVEKFSDVYFLRFEPTGQRLVREELPPLPRPASYAVAGVIDDVVHVAEGADFWRLDLGQVARGWQRLPRWPGDPRSVAVGGAQDGRFYLISGRSQRADRSWVFHTDVYAYDPRLARWSRIADAPWCVTAGLAHPVARTGLYVIGGDSDLDRWNEIERQRSLRDASPAGSEEWHRHDRAITFIYDHHTGFNQEILRYDTSRGTWEAVGRFPGPPQVTTPAVSWDGALAVVSGEVRPGVRTSSVWLGRV